MAVALGGEAARKRCARTRVPPPTHTEGARRPEGGGEGPIGDRVQDLTAARQRQPARGSTRRRARPADPPALRTLKETNLPNHTRARSGQDRERRAPPRHALRAGEKDTQMFFSRNQFFI